MIQAILNGDKDHAETFTADTAARCGLKLNSKTQYWHGNYTIIEVNDPYYSHARKFSNGHLVYLNPLTG